MDIVNGTIGFKHMLDGILSNVTWMMLMEKGMVRTCRGERYLQFTDVELTE